MKNSVEFRRKPYERVLVPDERGGYSAKVVEFPGCFAEGDTVDEAFDSLERAAESWIAASLELGHEIPEPIAMQHFSGRVALRLPRSIHKRAAQMAARDGVSLNQFLLAAVAAKIGS